MTQSLERYWAIGDRRMEGRALYNRGGILADRGDYGRAVADVQAAITILRAVGDRNGQGYGFVVLGFLAWLGGDVAEAERLAQAGLALGEATGDRNMVVYARHTLGNAARARGQTDVAVRQYRDSLEGCDHGASFEMTVYNHSALARAMIASGDLRQARHHTEMLVALTRDTVAVQPRLHLVASTAQLLAAAGRSYPAASQASSRARPPPRAA